MIKESLAVYHPEDKFEQAIQSSYHKYNTGWLTSYECRLTAKALARMKVRGEWMDESDLYDVRANHFFSPEMIGNMEEVVLPLKLLYLRDILENKRISSYLHDPIIFMSKPIAYYLMREYPIHLIVKTGALSNHGLRIGGLILFDEHVLLPKEAIVGFKVLDEMNRERILHCISQIGKDAHTPLQKAAVSLRRKGIFGLDYGIDLNLKANERVQNKTTKKRGSVEYVEPGDTGRIMVSFEDGSTELLSKEDFVKNYLYGLGKNQ